ncbi:G-D-S-L family lipolytic protein [Ascidiimonas aurantiaca]|uniref:SGNH/GDSL hydrolase family protein n=1 Tax=Ascidiimonas aurantiaca TaxID=1685432 RepID=UPI0030EEA375
MMNKSYRWLFIAFLGLIACESDDDNEIVTEVEITSGTADFTTYVSLGNSLTAGFTDGALFIAGQQNSTPNILATQFALAGGGTFTQPLMNDNLGGVLLGTMQILENRLFFNGSGPARLPGNPTTDLSSSLSGSFNNMGVPGAKSFHLGAEGYGNLAGVESGAANPYFARFASSSTASVIGDALAQNPTFFSLWIGNNDVLSYATSGGTGTDQTGNPDPTSYGPNDITDPTVFAQVYAGYVQLLTANDAKGVVANIPYVTSIPFFTTVPYNPVPLDAATAGQLNQQLIGPVIQIMTALGQGDRFNLLSSTESNPLLIRDENLTDFSAQLNAALQNEGVPAQQAALMASLYGQSRHATPNDLVLLPASADIGEEQEGVPAPFNTIGVTFPLGDEDVLLPEEEAEIRVAVDQYNATIASVAQQNGLAFVDANGLLQQIADTGLPFDEFFLRNQLVFGGAFSLDGVHPSARGYAFIANQFMKAINDTYGSNLPMVKAADFNPLYPAVLP